MRNTRMPWIVSWKNRGSNFLGVVEGGDTIQKMVGKFREKNRRECFDVFFLLGELFWKKIREVLKVLLPGYYPFFWLGGGISFLCAIFV